MFTNSSNKTKQKQEKIPNINENKKKLIFMLITFILPQKKNIYVNNK